MSQEKTIKSIEQRYKVNDIAYKGLHLWPILRYYLCVKKTANKSPVEVKSSTIPQMFSSFFYGLSSYFKKSDYMIMSSADQRKLIDGKAIDKSVDFIASKLNNSWILELSTTGHYKKKQLRNRNVSSRVPLLLFTRIYSKLLLRNNRIENQAILNNIISDLNVSVNTVELCKRHYAQYKVMRYFAKRKKWKAVFIVCHYTNMGYIKALRELKIPVIEIQHGLISKNHCAYNLYTEADTSFYPNFLLTFGENERKVFSNDNLFIDPENVIPVGHSYLEYIREKYEGHDELKKIIGNYDNSVAISSQDHPVENKLIEFIKKAALSNPKTVYIFIPRRYTKKREEYDFPENVIMCPGMNVYEIISHVQTHATVFSTVAIEAPALGKSNILVNIDDLSRIHLGKTLEDGDVHTYVNNTDEFNSALKKKNSLSKQSIIASMSHYIKPNYEENISSFLKDKIQ
tara:strand:- start:23726 stop:25096 length:1371 start_codon:yes stop_codon:yes gene_type:complete